MFERALRTSALVGTGAVVMALLSAGPALAAPAPPGQNGYEGEAYGTSVLVASAASSGATAPVTVGCGTPAGFHAQNSVASAAAGSLLGAGTVSTTADTGASPTRTATSARTQNLSLLGGLVTATAIQSVSTVTAGASGYTTSAAGTTLTGVKVLGLPVAVDPGPNTTIALPGVGRVVLNEQITSVTPTSASLTVNGLHVVVDQLNLLGIAPSTDIVVSHARSALTPPRSGFLTGVAYGSQAVVAGGVVSSGPTFPQSVPCDGTDGKVLSNTGAGLNLPGVATSGTIVDTARGTVTADSATAQTTSTIESVSLLNGLITAKGIKAVATATRAGGSTTVDDAGFTIGALTVNGQVVDPVSVGRDTAISVAGVGTLYLHRTLITAGRIEVRALELDVDAGSVAGVPTGTAVYVGVAAAGIS